MCMSADTHLGWILNLATLNIAAVSVGRAGVFTFTNSTEIELFCHKLKLLTPVAFYFC